MTRSQVKRARRGRALADRIAALEATVDRLDAALKAEIAASRARPEAPLAPAVSAAQLQRQLGRVAAEMREHAERQSRRVLEAESTVAEDMRDALQEIVSSLHSTRQTVAAGAKRRTRPVTVLFLVHQAERWTTLADVHDLMLKDPDFEVLVGSLPRFRQDGAPVEPEAEVSAGLAARGVRHIRLGMDPDTALDIVKAMAPDVIFRQAFADADLPPAFNAGELTFARLAYVPDGIGACDAGANRDLPLHRLLWRYYAPTAEDLDVFASCSPLGGANAILAGSPKFDRLLRSGRGADAWPIRGQRARKRLIWAPRAESSLEPDRGAFPDCWRQAAAAAEANPDVQILLKSDEGLFDRCRRSGLLRDSEIREFELAWAVLPNTATLTSDDYGRVFAASDAIITDDAGLIAEYLLFDKPAIFLDGGRNPSFGPAWSVLSQGIYAARGWQAAYATALGATEPGGDTMKTARRRVVDRLMPHPQLAGHRIVDDIRQAFVERREAACIRAA